jgi:hypothetical protein
VIVVHDSSSTNKKPVGPPPNGFRVLRQVSPDWSEPRFSGIYYAPAS